MSKAGRLAGSGVGWCWGDDCQLGAAASEAGAPHYGAEHFPASALGAPIFL
jgi:hypothetical protein